MPYNIGVMSGTSLDGVDVAIVDFDNLGSCQLIAAKTFSFPDVIHAQLHALISQPQCHLQVLGDLDTALGRFIGQVIQQFLIEQKIGPELVSAIGSHGHTLFHSPNNDTPFSLQIGNAIPIDRITRQDWEVFALECGFTQAFVRRRLKLIAEEIDARFRTVLDTVLDEIPAVEQAARVVTEGVLGQVNAVLNT